MPDSRTVNSDIEKYAGIEGRALISTVYREFGKKTAVLSSFGAESAVLLHMVSEVSADIPVLFIDTLKLFPETQAYRLQLIEHLGLKDVKIIAADPSEIQAGDPSGETYLTDKDLCCHIRKTVPLEKALHEFSALVAGRKRFHGALRSDLQFVSRQDHLLKVEPLAAYSHLDLRSYMEKHHLPTHPLRLQGYRSIGCVPCTAPGGTDEDPRAGRWAGMEKTECGIHFTANGEVIRTVNRQRVAA